MTAFEYAQLLLLGGGAVIGLFIGMKAILFLISQFIRFVVGLLRLIFREVPQLIVQVVAAFVASFITAIIADAIGVSVNELMAHFGGWVTAQAEPCITFLSEITAQIGTPFIS